MVQDQGFSSECQFKGVAAWGIVAAEGKMWLNSLSSVNRRKHPTLILDYVVLSYSYR